IFFQSSDDLFLIPSQEDMVDNLLSDGDGCGKGLSLAKALLPLTELCTTYSSSGICKYAERCQFAHGLHELHVPFRHPKYKTELCRSYHTTGYCYYGTRCLFVHSAEEQRPCVRRKRNVPCRTFQSFGVCPFGTRCNFLHIADGELGGSLSDLNEHLVQPQTKEWKPRGAMCRTFSSFGFCLYGTRCRFQHGLPNKILSAEPSPGPFSPLVSQGGLPSPWFTSSAGSSVSSSPPTTPTLTTPTPEATANNAFTFSSQHLSELLLPLALHLQQLENTKTQGIWDNKPFQTLWLIHI
uniref:mRNA decay activator protein ZFP36 n=1 Tax=Neogobius melanostomus TaxID=47308 RepID=A0A8C6U4W6_9GOBI